MKARKRTLGKDRLKDRSDIGEVEFSIEKLQSGMLLNMIRKKKQAQMLSSPNLDRTK